MRWPNVALTLFRAGSRGFAAIFPAKEGPSSFVAPAALNDIFCVASRCGGFFDLRREAIDGGRMQSELPGRCCARRASNAGGNRAGARVGYSVISSELFFLRLESLASDFRDFPPFKVRAGLPQKVSRQFLRYALLQAMSWFSKRESVLLLVVVLGALFPAGGCPSAQQREETLPVLTSDDPEAEAALEEAQESARAGELDTAELQYRRFTADHPNDPLVPVARFGLAQVLLAKGDADGALPLFESVADTEDPSLRSRALLYGGVAMHLRGQHQEARQRLDPLVGQTIDPEETSLLMTTLVAAAVAEGDNPAAVVALDELLATDAPEADRVEARTQLGRLVEGLPFEDLRRLTRELPQEREAWPMVAERALRVAFDEGELEEVRTIATSLRAANVELSDDLRTLIRQAERTAQVNMRAIGVVVPLSGRGREVGQAVLNGVMLAAGLPLDGPPSDETPIVFFRDSAGDPARAAHAVNELVTLHQVAAIIGPVDARAAAAAASRARELDVPIVTLSVGEVPEAAQIFRMLLSAEEEIDLLLERARAAGKEKVAIARPQGTYGDVMQRHAEVLATRHGMTFAGAISYEASATSFAEPMEQLSRLDYDALLLPDHSSRIALIAPAVAATQSSPQLLLPSVSFSERLVQTSARYLEGAFVVRAFTPPPAAEQGAEQGVELTPAQAFQVAYRARHDRAPNLFAAAGHDAFGILRQATREGEAETRAEVLSAIPNARAREPVMTLQNLGRASQRPRGEFVWRLRRGRLVPPPVEESPQG